MTNSKLINNQNVGQTTGNVSTMQSVATPAAGSSLNNNNNNINNNNNPDVMQTQTAVVNPLNSTKQQMQQRRWSEHNNMNMVN